MLQRIRGEFLEMPGLSLTIQQAKRLWGLDEPTCRELLEWLVEAEFLCRLPHGAYSRLTEGITDGLQTTRAELANRPTKRVMKAS
jgi:hypothetical protein